MKTTVEYWFFKVWYFVDSYTVKLTCLVNLRVKKGIRYLVSMRGKPFWWERIYPTSYSSSVSSDRWSVSTVSPCHTKCILYSDGLLLLHYLFTSACYIHACLMKGENEWSTSNYVSCERYDGIHELYKLSSGANGTLTCFCTLKPLNLILCESI